MNILSAARRGWQGPDTPVLNLDQLAGQLLAACNTAWQQIDQAPFAAANKLGCLHCQIEIPVHVLTACPAHAPPQALGLRLVTQGGPWAMRLARWLRHRWHPQPCTQVQLTVDYNTHPQTARLELRLGDDWCLHSTFKLAPPPERVLQ